MLNVECMYDVETLRSLNGNKMVRNANKSFGTCSAEKSELRDYISRRRDWMMERSAYMSTAFTECIHFNSCCCIINLSIP